VAGKARSSCVWVNAVATEGMLGDLNPLGDGPCLQTEVKKRERETFIGSLKTWFVTERSVASSCRAFRPQYF